MLGIPAVSLTRTESPSSAPTSDIPVRLHSVPPPIWRALADLRAVRRRGQGAHHVRALSLFGWRARLTSLEPAQLGRSLRNVPSARSACRRLFCRPLWAPLDPVQRDLLDLHRELPSCPSFPSPPPLQPEANDRSAGRHARGHCKGLADLAWLQDRHRVRVPLAQHRPVRLSRTCS